MPRLFWKLFLALWLSIMAFAVVVAWINQAIIVRNAIEEPVAFEANLERFKTRLARDLEKGGEPALKRRLANLPRGIFNHVFVLDNRGRELLGRDRMLKKMQSDRVKVASSQIGDADGKVYTLVTTGRRPPRSLLAPGPEGVGMRLGVAAVISALISLLLARYLAAPLGYLSRASRKLATGDLSVRVGNPLEGRKDEFGQLARDLDAMAGQLEVMQQANQRLLRDVSHELRSPLARLRVALEIARNKDQSQLNHELDRIELESERLEYLIDDVLGLLRESSAPQKLNLQQFNLAELLQDLVEAVNYEIGDEQLHIDLDLQPPLAINADRELIWRAFENLLRNAMIHSSTAGGIRIRARQLADNEVEVRVQDAGKGIPEAHIGRIFEPFYRVDESRNRSSGGHGLGLAIAASAIRRHGGTISAANREKGGLEVLVTLPLKPSGA
ncbi:MAG: HAMP domain-containing protein [Gammaproteobacteria bacterium]|nr:HAMP domain-containing protein [Gammaproteobacteria bacterium]NNK98451.1 HAMP domain-containing protein [Xanthomonadales bacterium]